MVEWRNIWKRREEIFSLIHPNTVIAILDVETTGLHDDAKIIQFSGVRVSVQPDLQLKKIDEIDYYINPQEPLSEKITHITGITNEMVVGAKTEKELAPIIFNWIESADVVVAYNKDFDLGKLRKMAERTRYMYDEIPSLDALEMARDLIKTNEVEDYKLGTIVSYFYPAQSFEFHSSLEDSKATAGLLQIFLRKYYRLTQSEEIKKPVHLEAVRVFINPHKPSQQRLKIKIQEGNLGDIYYDIVKKIWSCASNATAKKIFNSIDLEDLEKQMLKKYGYRFGNYSMDDIGKDMLKYKRKKNSERKSKENKSA